MHASMARVASTYRQVQVGSRTPLELVVMLYDGAIGAISQARDAMVARDLVAKRAAISKASAIVTHLQGSLAMDEGGEIALSLDGLYAYVMDQIVLANTSLVAAPLDDCLRVLLPLRDAWARLATEQAGTTGGAPGR
jgi:flagellar secretion chaperone FliS